MNLEFKCAIVLSGLKHYQVAIEMDWHPAKISAVIAETYEPTQEERDALAEILNRSVYDLFPPKRGVMS